MSDFGVSDAEDQVRARSRVKTDVADSGRRGRARARTAAQSAAVLEPDGGASGDVAAPRPVAAPLSPVEVGREFEGDDAAAAVSVCGVSTPWSEAEYTLLATLPEPAHDLEASVWCELELHHAGPHHGLAQISGTQWWWLQWNDPWIEGWDEHESPQRGLRCLPFCGDRDERGVECSLPAAHPGVHGYRLAPD